MVETGGLENRFPRKRDGGSNPSPSATYMVDQSGRWELTGKGLFRAKNCEGAAPYSA